MELNIKLWKQQFDFLWSDYINKLFKKGVPMLFSDQNKINFMGIIQGVSPQGKLRILLEKDLISEFDIKEIQMLY